MSGLDVCHGVAGCVKKVRIRRGAIFGTPTKHVLEPFVLTMSKGMQMRMMTPGHARPYTTGEMSLGMHVCLRCLHRYG